MNVGIITFPISKKAIPPLSNLVDILQPLSDELYLITGNAGCDLFKEYPEAHAFGFRHRRHRNVLARALGYAAIQLKIARRVLSTGGKVDAWFFYIGGEGLILPLAAAKLTGRKAVLLLAGFPSKGNVVERDALSGTVGVLSRIGLNLADKIVVYSEEIIKERDLEKYGSKIFVAHRHFVDFDRFKEIRPYNERENLAGYFGGLLRIKGVQNFVQAIYLITQADKDVKFLIGGEGELLDDITDYVKTHSLEDRVKILGWVDHDRMPEYLNELKLLVLPSYTEGLPNIVLEAMACGTPVLATRVGSIPDVITDGETGFILGSNSPEDIAEKVLDVLGRRDLAGVARRAEDLVKDRYNYSFVSGTYNALLDQLQ